MRLGFVTNIPNPYNGHLYAALRATGERVVTTYKGDPKVRKEIHGAGSVRQRD